jgi:DNA polymerase-3 subunit alpha
MSNFSHLHVHSTYSTLDGMCKIEELVSEAKRLGQPAIALTDHGSTSGLWQFQKECNKQGIKPILGTEFYYQRENDDGNGHLVVLAKNNTGLRNIFKLQEYAYVNNFYRKPRINWDKLIEYKEGLVVLSACLASTFCQYLMENSYQEAMNWAIKFQKEFGEDFYLEIQPNQMIEQWEVNKHTIGIANKLGINVVATNDVHYVYKDDHYPHEVLLAMQTKKKMSDEKRFKFETKDFWLRSKDEMIDNFNLLEKEDILKALNNTQEIVDKCNAEIKPGWYLPKYYDIPENMSSRKLLASRIVEGARNKGHIKDKEYMEEVQYELNVIDEEGYSDYFLIVQDYIRSARERGETVGDGRGSGAGSKVAYLLDITRLEPKKHNLLFERFMAHGRAPDIDQDFSNQEAVFKDLQSKYGENSVARIVTFGTMTPKAVFRKVMSTFEHPTAEINYLSKQIPDGVKDIETAIAMSTILKEASEKYEKEFKVMDRLQFTISHEGVHAGGVVVYNNLSEYIPIKTRGENRNDRIVAFDMNDIEELHFFKFDILGLETIGIISKTLNSIKDNTGKLIDLHEIDYNDEKVYDMLCSGDVSGVFQLSNQMDMVMEQQPRNFNDIIAINSFIRPGVGDFNEYLERRRGKEYYLHPDREYYMRETEGTIVYQEQYLLDCKTFAGWDIAYSDKHVRKNKNIIEDYDLRDKFYKDSLDRGYDKEVIVEIWNEICTAVSGGYSFNKSHSATYGATAYQTAWLKYYYPNEFYASLMSSEEDQSKISDYIAELKARGILINPPDINISEDEFVVTDKGINYMLTSISHVGENAIKGIKRIRPINSLSDLLERRKKSEIRGNVVVNLIKAGCFDFENPNRAEMMWQYEMSQRTKTQIKNDIQLPIAEWTDKLKCQWEKDALGLYLSVHPMEKYGFKPLTSYEDGDYNVLQGGEVVDIKVFNDKNKNEMAFVWIDTLFGIIKVIIFQSTWADEDVKNSIKEGNIIMVKGRRSGGDVLLNSVEVLE